jgi:hypothetical protein
MKLKTGGKYRILCEYKNHYDGELLEVGSIVEVSQVTTWYTKNSDICYALVWLKNSFPIFSHVFKLIAEEVKS